MLPLIAGTRDLWESDPPAPFSNICVNAATFHVVKTSDNDNYVSLIRFMRAVWVVCPRVPTPTVPNSSEETVPNSGQLNTIVF